jgi:hypothetical protein
MGCGRTPVTGGLLYCGQESGWTATKIEPLVRSFASAFAIGWPSSASTLFCDWLGQFARS